MITPCNGKVSFIRSSAGGRQRIAWGQRAGGAAAGWRAGGTVWREVFAGDAVRGGSEEGARTGAGRAHWQASPSAAGQRLEQEFRSEEGAEGLAGGAGIGLPTGEGVKGPAAWLSVSGKWWAGKVRPIPGNPPHDRPVSRESSVVKESLRRSLPHHLTPVPLHTEAPQYAFLRHGGIYLVRWGFQKQNQTLRRDQTASRWSAPRPGKRTRREDHALSHRPQMSSGRLFLDRVARQHCPSPLHRHTQINMHPAERQGEGDISTLPERGHFYFALTRSILFLDRNRELRI